MTVEEKVFAVLRNLPTVTAIVPEGRIKPRGDWQELDRPYIVHFPVAEQPIRTHEGLAGLNIWRFYQFSIFAASYGLAATLREALVAALDGYSDADINLIAYRGIGSTDFDNERGVAMIALNFEIAEGLRA